MIPDPARRPLAAWAPAILLAGLLLVAFQGAFRGRLFYLRDVTQNHLPVRALVSERLARGELPLWDPYHGGGTPLFANPNHLIAHPSTALFLVLPVQAAFTASVVLQFALLLWGAYLLLRHLPLGREAAALGSTVMALSGPAASLASMQNVLAAAAWVPLAIWAFLRQLESGRRLHRILAVVALAVVLLTGEPASALAYGALALALALTRPASLPEARPGLQPSRVAGSLLVVAGLAALLAAVQIVPAADLVGLSPRAHGLPEEEAMKWSLQPARLAEVVLPRFCGDATRLSPAAWWGRWLFEGGYPFLLSIYVGAAPLLLGAVALLGGGVRRRALVVGGIGAVFALMALGDHTPLYGTLQAVLWPLRQVRYPERFLIGAVFALAILAAQGLDHLVRQRQGARAWRWFAGTALALFLVATALVVDPTIADPFLRRALHLPEAILQSESGPVVRGSILRSLLWACIETAALAACAAVLARGGRRASGWAAWILAAICGLSMTVATAPARSTAAPGWLDAPSPLAGVVGHGATAPRLHHAPRPESLGIWARTDEQVWGFRFDRFTYSLLTGHADGVPTILDPATDRLDLAPSASLGSRLPALPLADRLRILRLAHAGFLLSYDDLADPGLVVGPVLEGLSRPPLRVYGIKDLLPRARFVPRARPPAYPDDLARSLADPGFDPVREVLLDGMPSDAASQEASAVVRV
ncbi:MAG TPA: hypothetical protein VFB95_00005, partial [Candidatus Cryosericum sp.]|nr:hypothetical protein [Candidatus Cryosericum sp.]